MASIPMNASRPTISEFLVTCREAGKPRELLSRVTREDVLAAARLRDIPVREGRLELRDQTAVAAMYFGLRTLSMRGVVRDA